MTFKDEILQEADGEQIEKIVVGSLGYSFSLDSDGALKEWAEVEDELDYEYDSGYGSPECHAVTAWTKSKVIFVGIYDGATWVTSVPRNPALHNPQMVGGG
jgi:hypothetical protein